jgi:glutamate synthase (ferredoxin)
MTLFIKHDILIKLEHGAVSADGRTGDGAGILLIFLMIFFKKSMCLLKTSEYAVGMVFYKKKKPSFCKTTFETAIRNQNLNIIGWRCSCRCFKSWTNRSRKEPIIKCGKNGLELTEQQFNAKLFAARKIAEHTILNSKTSESHMFYFSSLSTTIIYKVY